MKRVDAGRADGHESCRERARAMAEQAAVERLHEPAWWGVLAPVAIIALLLALVIAGRQWGFTEMPSLPLDGPGATPRHAAAPLLGANGGMGRADALAAHVVGGIVWPVAAICLLLGGYCHVLLAFIGHDAGHGAHSRSPAMNAAIGLWTFAHSFVNFFGFRAMHRGHHRHTGFDEDPSGDSPKFAKRVGLITYTTMVLFPLGFPLLVIIPSWLGGLGFQPRVYRRPERGKIRWGMLFVVAYHLALYRLLESAGGPGCYLFFLATYVAGLWLTTMVLALSHAGVALYTDCKLCNTRTVTTSPLFAWLTAYGGHHIEHHIVPQVPWYRMGRMHRILEEHGGSANVSPGFASLHLSALRRYLLGALDWTRSRRDAGRIGAPYPERSGQDDGGTIAAFDHEARGA